MTNSKIRKPVNELTPEDFQRCPVWEFALDEEGEPGQDETTVRPYQAGHILNPSDETFLIRASFTLADGTKLPGFLTPSASKDFDLGTIQPVVLLADGPLVLWCGSIAPSLQEISSDYSRLGKNAAVQVFPMCFRSEVAFVGGPIGGTVPGFLVWDDSEPGGARVVT
jgi:hypothetical protein